MNSPDSVIKTKFISIIFIENFLLLFYTYKFGFGKHLYGNISIRLIDSSIIISNLDEVNLLFSIFTAY